MKGFEIDGLHLMREEIISARCHLDRDLVMSAMRMEYGSPQLTHLYCACIVVTQIGSYVAEMLGCLLQDLDITS